MLNFTLSSRALVAVAALVILEQRATQRPMGLPVLAERLDVSLSTLEQVAGQLRRRGLVQSNRGPWGGYQLSRAARDISVAEIVAAVYRPPKSGTCRANIQGSWPSLSQAMQRCLGAISLQDLVDEQPHEPVHEPCPDAGHALRRGISTRPVLEPVMLPVRANTVFALAEPLE
jgi:Rrf2 family iron-sulfur cluster assembly transcriptional regulator